MVRISVETDIDLEDEIQGLCRSDLLELLKAINERLKGEEPGYVNPDRAYSALRHLRSGEANLALAELERSFERLPHDACERQFELGAPPANRNGTTETAPCV